MKFAGHEPSIPSLRPEIEELQRIIISETSTGSSVVIVNPSFGGITGSSAVNSLTHKGGRHTGKGDGRIIGITRLRSILLPIGAALIVPPP